MEHELNSAITKRINRDCCFILYYRV